MTETVLIYDEEESRLATEAQMQQTARRYGFGGQGGPMTEVGGPRVPMTPPQAVPMDLLPNSPFVNVPMPPSLAMAMPVQDHLLITPTAHAGWLRLVRMAGAQKLASWTLSEDAAAVVAQVLSAFGIQLTDLRESEDADG